MSISSSLDLFSLPDLFRLIEVGEKTGRLIVQTPINANLHNLKKIYYLWFRKGYLVAISDRLNHRGLITLVEQRNWLSPLITEKLRTLCPPEVSLGIYLEKMKLLGKDKLRLIFQLQLHQVYQLFELTSGWFRFDELSELQDRLMTLPWLEMTGYRMRATEVTMYALRLVKDWQLFAEKLPEPNFALRRLVTEPSLQLIAQERLVWEQADSLTSIEKIALELMLPIQEIQVVAFRLIVVGLVEEILLSASSFELFNVNVLSSSVVTSRELPLAPNNNQFGVKAKSLVSKSLLNNLLELLRSQFSWKS